MNVDIFNTNNKYNIIYADPPWRYGSKSSVNNSTGRAIMPLSKHYKTMLTNDISLLPIKQIIQEDAACFMWATDSHLSDALVVMSRWGFKYKTVAFNWIKKTVNGKTCVNVAPWTLKSSELCLLGTRGKMTRYKKNNSVFQLIQAQRTKHSMKPEEARQRIDSLFGDVPRIELFARHHAPGWDCWGDEITTEV